MAIHPDQPKDTIAALIARAQKALDLSDQQIANALDYKNPAVVQMIKGGQMRLPLNKSAPLANLLEMEPGEVMRTLLSETAPEMLTAIEECMGPLSLTAGEKRLLNALRQSAQGREPKPIFIEGEAIIALVVG